MRKKSTNINSQNLNKEIIEAKENNNELNNMNKDLDKKYNGILKEKVKLHNNLVETENKYNIIESKYNELMNNYNNIKVKNEKDEKEI